MDTLSGSVSSLKIPTAATTTLRHKYHQLHHHFNHQHPAGHLIISSTTTNYSKPPNNKTAHAFTTHNHNNNNNNNNLPTSNNYNLPFLINSSSSHSSSSVKQSGGLKAEVEFHHKKASTGYAVALLDAARAQNVLELANRDVKKLSKWLSNEQLSCIIENPNVEKKEKGEILKEIMKKGKFYYKKHLGKLVKLLVEKNKVEMLKDVLLEFQRMYDELSSSINSSNHYDDDHQVVLIDPTGLKMEDNQILVIAQRIQKITGADKLVMVLRQQLIT